MIYSLTSHSRSYNLSSSDCLQSALRLFSGHSYAIRHFELMKSCPQEQKLGHKILGVVQSIPLIGLLAALTERILVYAVNFFTSSKTKKIVREEFTSLNKPSPIKSVLPPDDERVPRSSPKKASSFGSRDILIPSDQPSSPVRNGKSQAAFESDLTMAGLTPFKPTPKDLEPLLVQSERAILDHLIRHPTEKMYATVKQALPTNEVLLSGLSEPLTVVSSSCEDKGKRNEMEDRLFFWDTGTHVLAGVFDGHGGSDVSKRVGDLFITLFLEINDANGDVPFALNKLFQETAAHILEIESYNNQGSTGVVSVVDKTTGLVYTATLGDSKAALFRNGKVIPLSPIIDWRTPEEEGRARKIHGEHCIGVFRQNPEKPDEELFVTHPGVVKAADPKELYLEKDGSTLNVSSAFGDGAFGGAVGTKHTLTVNKVQPGDQIVIGCDGLWDFVSPKEIDQVLKNGDHEEMATHLTEFTLKNKHGTDNVSIITLSVS